MNTKKGNAVINFLLIFILAGIVFAVGLYLLKHGLNVEPFLEAIEGRKAIVVEESVGEPIGEPVGEVAEESSEEPVDEVEEEPTEESEESSEEPAEDPAGEVTEEPEAPDAAE